MRTQYLLLISLALLLLSLMISQVPSEARICIPRWLEIDECSEPPHGGEPPSYCSDDYPRRIVTEISYKLSKLWEAVTE